MKDIKVNLSFENLKIGLVDVEGNEIKIGDAVMLNNNKNDLAKVCFGEFGVRNIETEEIVDYVIGFYLKTIETDIKNCKKFLTVYGFNSDEISPFKISEMTNEDLLKVDIYALEYFDIYEWANWEVFQKSIETYGEIICAAHILYEMTFFGTNIKESRESLLDDLLDDMEYSKTPLVLCDKRI